MAFGPKSKQRNARVSRDIKRFAQRIKLHGHAELVDFIKSGVAHHAVIAAHNGLNGHYAALSGLQNARTALARRGLPKRALLQVVREVRAQLETEARQAFAAADVKPTAFSF